MQAVGTKPEAVTDDALFARIYPGLRRFAAVTAPIECDPDDLVQEAVARTLRRHALTDLDHPAAYLRRAIVNLASNERRTRARWRVIAPRVAPSEPGRVEAYTSDLGDLMQLDPVDRALLYLVEVEGASYREAGDAVGIAEDTARTRASRARKRLRVGIEGET